MSQSGPVVLSISVLPNVSGIEVEALKQALEGEAQLQPEMTPRSFDWVVAAQTFIAIIEDLGKVAGGIVAVVKLGEKLLEWRNAARAREASTDVIIEHPGRPPLNLSKASDAEVRAWFDALSRKDV